jgi:hypothetical protein
MKKIFYFILVMLCMESCAPMAYSFRQIGTLTSDNVTMNEKGYEYSNPNFTISYNFWSEGGNVVFTVTNNSDKDIYLLMDQCYFVVNGWAHDYYKARTYVSSFATSSSVATTAGVSVNANAQLSGQLSGYAKSMVNTPISNVNYTNATVGYGASKMVSGSLSNSAHAGSSTETPEAKIVCIPAHSAKQFSEFNVMGSPYRVCGFARDPQEKDGVNWNFSSALDSPRTIENRLMFNVEGEVVPVVNTFYISQLTNISENNCFVWEYSEDCNGNKSWYPDVRIDKTTSPNKFFTNYIYNKTQGNDRMNKK